MIVNIRRDKLNAELEKARRDWEEMDPAYTSFEMRKRAETRYLTLRALAGLGAVEVAPARLVTPEQWRVAAALAFVGMIYSEGTK